MLKNHPTGIARHQDEGPDGLRAKPAPGRAPRLTVRQRTRLLKLLLKGATAHGFSTALWTLPHVATVIARTFGVTYHPAHVWKILRGEGWTCQKPERRAKERDEAARQRQAAVAFPRPSARFLLWLASWIRMVWADFKPTHAGLASGKWGVRGRAARWRKRCDLGPLTQSGPQEERPEPGSRAGVSDEGEG